MTGIAAIDCWYDVGYYESSLEIPPKGHQLRDPDLTLEGPFNPSKNREFSEIRLELPFSDAVNISYLRLHYDFNNGESQTFYAWVDDVRLLSDSENAPMVNVLYHIDPWRTWNSKISFGSGFVGRRPSDDNDYWQNFPFNCLRATDRIPLFNTDMHYRDKITWWVLIAQQWMDDKISRIRYSTFPLMGDPSLSDENVFMCKADGSEKCVAPKMFDVMYARFDELFEWDPKTITGAWLCPINPMNASLIGDGTEGDPIHNSVSYKPNWEVQVHDFDGTKYGWFESSKEKSPGELGYLFKYTSIGLGGKLRTTELSQYKVIGPMDEVLGSLPFAIDTAESAIISVNASSCNAYIRFDFGKMSEGMVFDYILPTIEINENCWSSYAFSGQRDYENNMRNIQTWSSAVTGAATGGGMGALIGGMNNMGTAGGNGIKNTWGLEKVIGGAGAGALMGGPAGAIAGAVIGAGASIIGGAIQGQVFDPQIRTEEDKLHAKQANGVILTGQTSYLFLNGFNSVKLVKFEPDEAAKEAINANKAVQGVKYGQNMEDCNALIDGGGPMQITNLIIHGNAPVLAKKAIQAKFAKGVRIIER